MLVAIAYHPRDQDQALRLASWIKELGPYNHSLLVVRDARCKSIIEFEQACWESFQEIVNPTVVDGWPQGANFVFQMTARYIKDHMPQPWLFLEPDAIPLRKGWLDALETQYKEVGKPFMGDLVGVKDVPAHMSGNAIYPADLIAHGAGAMLNCYDLAFDMAAKDVVLTKMHDTALIEHAWKHPAFESWDQVQREVDLEHAVVYHASKDGSLIELLRKNLGGGVIETQHGLEAISKPDESKAEHDRQLGSTRPAQLIPATDEQLSKGIDARGFDLWHIPCDILIKTYPKDYEWLWFCLRGLQKFATGFRRIIILHPINELGPELPGEFIWRDPDDVKVVPVQENGHPYLFQQAIKFSAHEWTDAPYILHIDSDTVPCVPFSPNSFISNGKPLWLMTPYSAIQTPWQIPTEKFLGEPVEFEFMRRFPIMLPRSLHVAAAKFVELKHKKSATEYIVSQPGKDFSEFNALGALAFSRAHEDFVWLDTTKEPLPPLVAIQSWSHGGLTNELKAKFEGILNDNTPTDSGAAAGIGNLVSDDTGVHSDIRVGNKVEAQGIHQTKEGWWVIDDDTHISKWVEEEGRLDHDVWMLPKILPEIHEGDTVVDAGAFIGDHAIAYVKAVGNTGRVICFEPNPLACQCLRLNLGFKTTDQCGPVLVGEAKTRVEAYEVALSDGERQMLPFEDAPNAGAATVTFLDKDDPQPMCGTVRAIMLDSLKLDRLDFFKIDVEGHELKVLQGAKETIARCRPKMLIEINKWALLKQHTEGTQIFDWLREHDYKWQSVQELHIADPPQYDILCRPLAYEAKLAKRVPWESPLESQNEVRELVGRLKEFCTHHRTRFVRTELAIAGVTEKPKGYSWQLLRKKKTIRKRRLAAGKI